MCCFRNVLFQSGNISHDSNMKDIGEGPSGEGPKGNFKYQHSFAEFQVYDLNSYRQRTEEKS